MKNGWDDILRFIFNSVAVLAILGVLFLVKLLFDFVRWVGFDHSHGDPAVLIVGRKAPGDNVRIINQFQGKEAEELYRKLVGEEDKND